MSSSPQAIKVGFVSLGCAKNLVDSEVMLGSLLRDGMEVTRDAQEADVVIVNTCGFIEGSKKESIDAILKANELRETGNCKALIMAGCLTQRYPKDLRKELPEVDAIVGLNEVPRIGEIVRDVLTRNGHTAPRLYWSVPGELCARLCRATISADTAALRVCEDRRGLQSSVHVLQYPAHPRKASEPGGERRFNRDSRARRVRRAGDQPDFAGHDILRQGPRPESRRGRAMARGCSANCCVRFNRSKATSGCGCCTRIRITGPMS